MERRPTRAGFGAAGRLAMIEMQRPASSHTTAGEQGSRGAEEQRGSALSPAPLPSHTPIGAPDLAYCGLLLLAGVIGWGGVALAEIGAFRAFPLALLLLIALGVVWLALRRLGGEARGPVDWIPIALTLLCIPLYFRPHEYIMGGADAGVYVTTGVNLARTGSLLIQDAEVARLSEQWGVGSGQSRAGQLSTEVWTSLFRADPGDATARYIRFPGYYLSNDRPGLVIPQFYALQSVWVALASLLGGVWAGLYVTPIWAVLGVLGVYYTGQALFGRPVGALAALLLAITPTQIWFARYPTAEALTQALLWGGFYAWIRFTDRGAEPAKRASSVFGLLAGLLLGLTFLARIDLPYLALLPAAWLVYRLATQRAQRRDLWFLIPFGLLAVHGAAHALVFARPYTLNTYGGVSFLAGELGPIAVVASAMGLAAFVAVNRIAARAGSFRRIAAATPELAGRLTSATRLGLVAGLIGLAVYGYFIRPALGAIQLVPYAYGATQIPLSDHENMVRLGWYLTPLGIWLGVAGMALIAWRERWERLWFPLGLALLATLLYLYRVLNNPHHIYTMRRYVPLAIPLFALAAAYALVWLWGRRTTDDRRQSRVSAVRLAAAGLSLTLVLWLGYRDRVVLPQVEYAGLIGQVNALAAEMAPGSVVIFDDPAPVGSGAMIGTPLQYVFGLSVFDLQVGWSRAGLDAAVRLGLEQGRPVYLLARPGGEAAGALTQAGLRLSQQRQVTIDAPVLEQSYDHFPTAIHRFVLTLDLYQVVDRSDD